MVKPIRKLRTRKELAGLARTQAALLVRMAMAVERLPVEPGAWWHSEDGRELTQTAADVRRMAGIEDSAVSPGARGVFERLSRSRGA